MQFLKQSVRFIWAIQIVDIKLYTILSHSFNVYRYDVISTLSYLMVVNCINLLFSFSFNISFFLVSITQTLSILLLFSKFFTNLSFFYFVDLSYNLYYFFTLLFLICCCCFFEQKLSLLILNASVFRFLFCPTQP